MLGGVKLLTIYASNGTTQVVDLPMGYVYRVTYVEDEALMFLVSFNRNGAEKFGAPTDMYFYTQVNFGNDGNGHITVTLPNIYKINFYRVV